MDKPFITDSYMSFKGFVPLGDFKYLQTGLKCRKACGGESFDLCQPAKPGTMSEWMAF